MAPDHKLYKIGSDIGKGLRQKDQNFVDIVNFYGWCSKLDLHLLSAFKQSFYRGGINFLIINWFSLRLVGYYSTGPAWIDTIALVIYPAKYSKVGIKYSVKT